LYSWTAQPLPSGSEKKAKREPGAPSGPSCWTSPISTPRPASSLAQRIAGTFEPTPELTALAAATGERFAKLHRRAQRAKALRKDVTTADVILLLEMLSLVDIPGHGEGLRRRYLALILESLRFGSTGALPGPPATGEDLAARWRS
jgi:hypothetical protein